METRCRDREARTNRHRRHHAGTAHCRTRLSTARRDVGAVDGQFFAPDA